MREALSMFRQILNKGQKQIIDGVLYSPYLQHAQKSTPEPMQRQRIGITHRLEALQGCDEVVALSGRKAEIWSRKT